jgi:hypothetical protein
MVEEFIASQAVFCQHRVTDWQNQKRSGLFAADRAMPTHLIVEAGDSLFINRTEQHQVATAVSKPEAIE